MSAALYVQPLPSLLWYYLVNNTVTEPYLDEVFHVRQAQHYCQRHFDVWDPKITTPPGLYLLATGLLAPFNACSLVWLRILGVVCLTLTAHTLLETYKVRAGKYDVGLVAQHSVLNITLFPPLFFFCALFYTDVPSTFMVLRFYLFFVNVYYGKHGNMSASAAWIQSLFLILYGILALLFRQTNIFWVAIFPAGIMLINTLDRGHDAVRDSMHRRVGGFGDTMMSVARTSWKMEVVYDLPVREAWLEDYVKTLLSIAVCAVKALTQPQVLLNIAAKLAPYLTLIALFAGFIVWNDAVVVLGDKSNHVATIHLAQMLYIWPYFTFFSWPLLYPYICTFAMGVIARLPDIAPLEAMLVFRRRRLVPRLWVLGVCVALTCVVVRCNTIVHPFILADNRHYTFYVFRLLTRNGWWVKYAVTPIYVLCGWACVQALGARTSPTMAVANGTPANSSDRNAESRKGKGKKGSAKTSTPAETSQSTGQTESYRPLLPDGTDSSAKSSFVLIWLATTTLQLVTAPLVEPRYLILPWIFWRMHVPLQSQYTPAATMIKNADIKREASKFSLMRKLTDLDIRIVLETVWFVAVNAATGYIFLKWGFEWAQEPGKVQRFMW